MSDLVISVSPGGAQAASLADPLPVTNVIQPSAAVPLAGQANASGTFGPFVPELNRDMWITLSGNWQGTVQVLRSVDGGVTKLPLTAGGAVWATYTADAQERIGQETVGYATYYVQATLTSGALGYDLRQ